MEAFEKLRVDRNSNRYTADALGRAPHKPLLLLAVLELIESGEITENRIEPSSRLIEALWTYAEMVPQGRRIQLWLPFHHMQSESFWTLIDHDGASMPDLGPPKSVTRLRTRVNHARFDDTLWDQLQDSERLDQAKKTILKHHFAPAAAMALAGQLEINLETTELFESLGPTEVPPQGTRKQVRNPLFSRRIREAYDHRCAFTGLRLITPTRTAIDAAHIKPWAEFHDDSIQNGMALSKLCHWAFDAGLLTVNREFEIVVSRLVRNQNQERVEHLLDLDGQSLHLPDKAILRPQSDNLAWHRKHRFNSW